jgi:hypothetical protein
VGAGRGALEQELPLAGVARERGGALELDTGLVEPAELLEEVAIVRSRSRWRSARQPASRWSMP